MSQGYEAFRERLATVLDHAVRGSARRPGLTLGLVAVVLAGCGVLAARLQVDPGNEALFLANDPARAALEEFRRDFGGDEQVIVALLGPVLEEAGLARLAALTERLAAVPGVSRALSLTNAQNLYLGPAGPYPWAPYEWVRDGERTVAQFAAEVVQEPLFAGNLVARDGKAAAVVVTLDDGGADLVEAIRAAATEAEGGGINAYVAGFPVERHDFARFIREDQGRFIPLVVLVIALVCGALFRQVWGVLLPLAVVGATVLPTLALASLAGIALNAVTSLLTPVVMVVSVALAVNLCVAYTQGSARGVEGVVGAYRRVGAACLFTTLTTVLGFASLAVTDVPAIREFGLLCAIGVALSYVAALLVLPPLFALVWHGGPRHLRAVDEGARWQGWLARVGARGGLSRLVLAAALGALAAAGIVRLQVDTDILAQLPPDSDLARATRTLDQALGGVNLVEVVWRGPPDAAAAPATVQALRAVADRVLERHGDIVAKTFSVADVVARLNELETGTRALPSDPRKLSDYLGLLRLGGEDSMVRLFLNEDGSAARLSLRLAAVSASRTRAVIDTALAEARSLAPPGVRVEATGQFVLIQNMTAQLPREQATGLMLATVCIIAAIGLALGSLGGALLAAIPASVPIVAAYGLMGWLGIPLSTATSMIASVVLGIAVDSTILFAMRYRVERRAGLDAAAARGAMLGSVGRSVAFSNLALVCGFAVAAASRFPPVRDFGVLCAATIATSFLAATFVLPALLRLWDPLDRPRS